MFKSKEFKIAVLFTLVAISIAFGLSDHMNFLKSLSILVAVESIIYYFLILNEEKPITSENSELDNIVDELGSMVEEQGGVIKEYEEIFDQQLVELPCVCGGNTFQGLFSPKIENIVECEKCESKYRVTVNYNSVLISEPLDINDDKLIKKITKLRQ
jgi:hypothetical protein